MTFKCQSTAVVTVGHLAVAGKVCPSFPPAAYRLSGCFLGIISLGFSEFQHGAKNPYQVVCDSQIFWENYFCPKNWGNGPKVGFFEFKEKFGH